MKLERLLALDDRLDLFDDERCRCSEVLIRNGLTPPLPVSAAPEPHLIWGFAVARRAAKMGIGELATRDVHVDAVQGLELALALENRSGEYSWPEQDRIVSYMDEQMAVASAGDGAVSSRRAEVVGRISRIVRGDTSLVDLIARYRTLGAEIRSMLHDGLINLRSAVRIRTLPEAFLMGNRAVLERLSFSNRRQFLEVLAELWVHGEPSGGISGLGSAREEAPAVEQAGLLASAEAALNGPDPVQGLLALRYPELTRMKRGFSEVAARATGGAEIRIDPPPSFEGDEVTVHFSFRSARELDEKLGSLSQLREYSEELLGFL